MFLKELFASFLKEKSFLVGVLPKTVRSYWLSKPIKGP